jgi:hypothetical protein
MTLLHSSCLDTGKTTIYGAVSTVLVYLQHTTGPIQLSLHHITTIILTSGVCTLIHVVATNGLTLRVALVAVYIHVSLTYMLVWALRYYSSN